MNINIDEIIVGCLEGDRRRIIIPGFGAFVKRPEGEIVFIDILNTDDGALTAELQRRAGLNGDEAHQAMEKYSFHLKTELLYNKAVKVEGIGTVRMTPDGSFEIDLPVAEVQEDPVAAPAPENEIPVAAAPIPEEEGWENIPEYAYPEEQSAKGPEAAEAPHVPVNEYAEAPAAQVARRDDLSETGDAATEDGAVGDAQASLQDVPTELKHVSRSQREREILRELLYGDEDEVVARQQVSAENGADGSSSGVSQLDDRAGVAGESAQGAAYRSNRYNFGSEPQAEAPDELAQGVPQVSLRKPKRKRVDFVIVIAVIALLVFAAVFVYYEFSNGNINFDLKELIHSGGGESAAPAE